MRHIHKALMVAGISMVFLSCGDFLDINQTPNAATVADPKLLFVSEAVGLSNNRNSEIWIPIGITSQVFASGGAVGWGTDEDQYNISIFSTGNTWRELYTNVIKNSTLSIADAMKADPVPYNMIAQHKILQAYAYWELTSIFGDVPFTEAARTDIDMPAFDPQATVLQGIVNQLDDAIKMIDDDKASPAALRITTEDVYYKGDMTKWKKLANGLKLRVLMMMVDADPSKAADIKTVVEAGAGLAGNADNMMFAYYNQAGNYNPMYNLFHTYNGDVNNWLFAIDHTTKLLKDRRDPRLTVYFDPGPAAGTAINSVPPAAAADPDNDAVISELFLQPDAADPLFTYSEQTLLEAEAYARGLVGAVNMTRADAKLRAGITANMKYYGVSDADISKFLGGLPALAGMSQADAVKLIAEQQWLDLFNRSVESWVQWRRTEVPALTPPSGTLVAGMIRRWQYPPLEIASNSKAPAQKQLDDKMWFDK